MVDTFSKLSNYILLLLAGDRLYSRGRKWKTGRPKQTWQNSQKEDMQEMNVSSSGTHDKAKSVASVYARWR